MIRVLVVLLAVSQVSTAVLVHRLRRDLQTVASGVATVMRIQLGRRQSGDRS